MPIYALIVDNKVANVIIAENQTIAEEVAPNDIVVDITDNTLGAGIGWGYEKGKFIDPRPVAPPPVPIKE